MSLSLHVVVAKLLLLASLVGILALSGCASAPPPRPVSDTRQQALRTEASGREQYDHHNWSASALLFQHAAELYRVLDDDVAAASALHNQAQALRLAGRIDAALDAYHRALKLNEKHGRLVSQAENLDGISQCQSMQKKYDPAVETLDEALTLAATSSITIATLQNDLALVLLRRGQPADNDRIISLLTAALKVNESSRTTPFVAANRLNLGRAYLQFGQLDQAEQQLRLALDQFKSVDDPVGLAHTHEALGHLYLSRHDKAHAAEQFQLARDKFAFLKDEDGLHRLEQVQ